jgi:site-specific DNA recombinase
VLIVREIDRFARSLAKQLIVEEELRRAGVEIDYVLGEYPDTPEGNLNKNIKAVIAEYERLKIAERTTRARRRMAREGHVVVRKTTPFGYRTVEKDGKREFAIREEEARTVRLIYKLYTEGDGQHEPMSMYGIIEYLSQARIPTWSDLRDNPGGRKQRGYGQWNKRTVAQILENETYAGIWHYAKLREATTSRIVNPREEWIPVKVPAIVSRETWEAAQRKREENKHRGIRIPGRNFLFRQRAKCGHCGAPMWAHTHVDAGVVRKYYRCTASHARSGYVRRCAQTKGFRADYLDTAIWHWIKEWLSDPEQLEDGLQALQENRENQGSPLGERLAVIESLVTDHKGQLERLC